VWNSFKEISMQRNDQKAHNRVKTENIGKAVEIDMLLRAFF